MFTSRLATHASRLGMLILGLPLSNGDSEQTIEVASKLVLETKVGNLQYGVVSHSTYEMVVTNAD